MKTNWDGPGPLALTLVTGTLLVAAPLFVLPHAGSPTYRHAVHPADGGERFVVETVRQAPSTALQRSKQALSTFGVVLVGAAALGLATVTGRIVPRPLAED